MAGNKKLMLLFAGLRIVRTNAGSSSPKPPSERQGRFNQRFGRRFG